MSPDEIFPIFFVTWVILGVISFVIFFLGNNAQLKRKLWPPFVVGTGVLFIGFTYAMGFGGKALYITVPAVILIIFLNLRLTSRLLKNSKF